MIRFALALLAALLPTLAHADVVAYYTTGQTLYVRFDDASNTAVDLTEGSGLKLGRYVAADAAIDSAGLAAGTYSGRVFIGTAGAQASGDVEVAVVPEFIFGASTQTTSYQNTVTLIGASTPLASFFNNLTVTLSSEDIEDLTDAMVAAGVGAITDADAMKIAAKVLASRGDFYPNRNQVWVLRRTDGGVTVKNDFEITKKAGESLKVWVDFAGILGRNEAVESIESIDVDGGTATIVVDSEEIVGNLVAVTITGGAADDITTLNLEVMTTEDQTITVDACTMNVVE